MSEQTQPAKSGTAPLPGHETSSQHPEIEDYAGGYIQAYHGTIPVWLLLVYLVLFVFAMFYMVVYWGGLGPGLGY
jgi:hypothetical protein